MVKLTYQLQSVINKISNHNQRAEQHKRRVRAHETHLHAASDVAERGDEMTDAVDNAVNHA